MFKRLISVLLVIVCSLSFTACWDHVEISELLIIAGVGLDIDDTGRSYRATVEVINVEAEGGENIAAEIVEGNGKTIYSALQNAMLMTGGAMFSNHCKVFVIGDRLARQGINDIVDVILRSPNFRKSVDILVARDGTAEDILKKKTVKNDIVSYELAEIARSNAKIIKNTTATNAYKLHETLISDNAYFVVPAVFERNNNGDSVLEIDGCAVFKDDKLQGFLDGEQAKLLNLLTEKADNVTLTMENIALSKKPLNIRITKSDVRVTPEISRTSRTVRIYLQSQAVLEGSVLLDADLTDSGNITKIQNSLNEELSYKIKRLIIEVQLLYGTDIFDFYREYEDRFRREWPVLSQNWDTSFKSLDVSVVSDIQIKGSGLVGNYAPEGDGDNANALP